MTRPATDGASSADYNQLPGRFSETEIANLTVLIDLINLWNRVGGWPSYDSLDDRTAYYLLSAG
ncbi:MAG: hypothetical protein P4L90_24620 [Rhodopila sp.]|nr:hypothetical protein [Rhodopila sp.]